MTHMTWHIWTSRISVANAIKGMSICRSIWQIPRGTPSESLGRGPVLWFCLPNHHLRNCLVDDPVEAQMGPQVQQHLESIVCIRWRQRTKYPSFQYFALHLWELEWLGAWHFMITKANTALDTVSLLFCCISILYEHTNSLRLPGIKFFGMANGWIAWESCSAKFCDSLLPVELHQTRWKRPWEDGLAAVLLVVLCIGAISSSATHVHSLLAVEQILLWSLAFRSRSSCFNCRAGRLDCLSLCDLILFGSHVHEAVDRKLSFTSPTFGLWWMADGPMFSKVDLQWSLLGKPSPNHSRKRRAREYERKECRNKMK